MKIKIYLLTLFTILIYSNLSAQELTVHGTVKGSDGIVIPGVNIVLKGTKQGVSTDFDGNYEINVSTGDILVFSYVGFSTEEIEVTGSTLNVTLKEGEQLSEVVVTALGIKKEKRALSYSVQQVQSEELLKGNQNNMLNTLQGKVSGVTVTNSGGAPGSSSIILIRGGSSITGDNQPLIVVDGIPIDNSTTSSLETASINRASDINPEDIESISVLKGPSAAALYGIQAANGAVLITTKKGKAGTSSISYSGSFSVDEVLGTPDLQMNYGQGFRSVDGDGDISYSKDTPYSWGEALDAQTPRFNHIKDFYNTAITHNHNVSYSGGSEKNQVYLSVGDLSQEGIIKSTSYDKTSVKLNTTTKFSEDLTFNASANYITTRTGSVKQGNATGSSFTSLLAYPIDVDIHDYYNSNGSQKTYYAGQTTDNPYWSIENSPNNDKVHRLIGIATLSYNFLKDFNITYRLGTDYYNQINKKITGTGSLAESRANGYISQFDREVRRTTSNLTVNYSKNITDNLAVDALFGNTVEDYRAHSVYTYGDGFLAPGIYSIGNVLKENQSISEILRRKRTVGVFGEIKFSWKNALFLSATGRNDWSSTLPSDKRSFFYPSVGASAVISDLLRDSGNDITSPNGLSYLKLRATWARVGKDAPIGVLESYLSTNINSFASDGYTWNGVDVGNPALEPEFTDSWEFGVDSRFFDNKLRIDLTYYRSVSDNQILEDIRVPPTTGTFYATLNGGSIRNSGIESLVSIDLFSGNKDFSWTTDLNFAANKSYIIELPGQLDNVYLSDSWTFNSTAAGAAILNGSLFGLRGNRPVRDDNGQLVIGDNGYPLLEAQTFDNVTRIPKWTLGITNSFQYKNFGLSFLLDIVQGNDIYNATKSALTYYGLSDITTNREGTVTFEGVDSAGNSVTSTVPTDQDYYRNYYYQNAENFVEDGSYIRMRYVTLSYQLPKSFLDKLSFTSASLSVTARNLFTVTNYSGVDPEVNTFGAGIAGAGSMGIDNLGTPNTRGFDLALKFKF